MTVRLTLLLVRLVVNVLVVGVLGGSGYLIYLVADNLDTSLDIAPWLDDLLRTYRVRHCNSSSVLFFVEQMLSFVMSFSPLALYPVFCFQ